MRDFGLMLHMRYDEDIMCYLMEGCTVRLDRVETKR